MLQQKNLSSFSVLFFLFFLNILIISCNSRHRQTEKVFFVISNPDSVQYYKGLPEDDSTIFRCHISDIPMLPLQKGQININDSVIIKTGWWGANTMNVIKDLYKKTTDAGFKNCRVDFSLTDFDRVRVDSMPMNSGFKPVKLRQPASEDEDADINYLAGELKDTTFERKMAERSSRSIVIYLSGNDEIDFQYGKTERIRIQSAHRTRDILLLESLIRKKDAAGKINEVFISTDEKGSFARYDSIYTMLERIGYKNIFSPLNAEINVEVEPRF